MKSKRTWAGVAAAVCVCVGAPAWGHPHPDEPPPNLEKILDGLERGIVALEQLDREDEAHMLRRVAEGVRQRMQDHRAAAHHAEGQLEALRLAMNAFREEDRIEAIELTERAIHARELYLEGDREDRQRGPRREQCVELMELAANIYTEYGALDRAERIRRLARQYWPHREGERRGERRRERGPKRGPSANEIENRIEVMRIALPALLEANRRDAAEMIERAVHALRMDMEQRRDHEAAMIRNNAPSIGRQIEILQMASGLWREFGHHERAVVVGELAEQMAAESRLNPERRERLRRELHADDRRDIEQLQEQFDRLERALEDMRRRLRDGR